jgi:PAS domain S-box-containing protein
VTWRSDLLEIMLRVVGVLGAVVYVPSVLLALRFGLRGIVVLDSIALAAVFALARFKQMPAGVRAGCTCATIYVTGAGLMVGVGSIGQSYLIGFCLITVLLLNIRWGLAAVALSAITMWAIGFIGLATPEMAMSRWTSNLSAWSVVTLNFTFVTVGLVIAVGAVVRVLDRERTMMVVLNADLAQEVVERTRSDASLRENRALLRIAGTTARFGGWRVAVGGTRVEWSDEVCALHDVAAGTSPTMEEAIAFFAPEYRQLAGDAAERSFRDGTPFNIVAEIVSATGTHRWINVIGDVLRTESGAITHVHGATQDITEQKRAEESHDMLEQQLRQAQKLETVGSLAGGIAHDFNNLLTVVLSYSEMLAEDLDAEDPIRQGLDEIRTAGLRASDLTRQLLAFSRRQVLAPKLVDLSDSIAGMAKMLQRLIGEDIELTTSSAQHLGKVLVDPGQIEQVIMNLAVNARDAMPQGGVLTIETREMSIDESHAAEDDGGKAGPHVMLAVSDTGSGMDKATQARIFEPFFTTKEVGKGTGLGLSMVFGIVRQSGGRIWVSSEPGKGTTFKLYFPIAADTGVRADKPVAVRGLLRGTETILLVEDEDAVRILARSILGKCGYTVLEAQNGADALLICAQHPAPIDLLLTDVVMPRMNGRELAQRLQQLRPGMKVLYMSGYTDDAIVRNGLLHATLAFIQKPVTPEPLARKLREVLDAEPT